MTERESSMPPEYNFTARELMLAAAGDVHQLQEDWLDISGGREYITPAYVSDQESERLGVAGSGYNDILDFDHAQLPSMIIRSDANRYAYGTKRRVEAMLDEAYAANAYPDGPTRYFADQKTLQEQEARKHMSLKDRVAKKIGALITNK